MSYNSKESGNILLSSLLVMMAVNLLAVLLVQLSNKEFVTSEYKASDSMNFYLAETCVEEVMSYFRNQDSDPTTLPNLSRANLDHLYTGITEQGKINNLAKYSYNCDITNLTVKSVEGMDTGISDDISLSDGYGASGDLSPKYFYQVDAESFGPKNSKKKILSIVSVEY
jgi:Tfp pilus assembly protein PilX